MIKKAISLGVAKINVNTECQLAFADATRKYIEAGKDLEGKGFDPRKLLAPGAAAHQRDCEDQNGAVRFHWQGRIKDACGNQTFSLFGRTFLQIWLGQYT